MPETRTTGNNGALGNFDLAQLLHAMWGPTEIMPGFRTPTLRSIERNAHDQWDRQRGMRLREDITFTFEGTPPPFELLDCFGHYGYRLQREACQVRVDFPGRTQSFTLCYVRVGQ